MRLLWTSLAWTFPAERILNDSLFTYKESTADVTIHSSGNSILSSNFERWHYIYQEYSKPFFNSKKEEDII